MKAMQDESAKQKQNFDGILTAGLIIGIIGSSIIIAVLGCLILYFLLASSLIASTGVGALVGITVFIVVFFCLILMIGQLINLILTVKFLKGKSGNKTTIGILNIFFGGVISGILILVGEEQKDNV